jgi:sulfoxide reductase heme-binding subunit YedZ
MSTTYRAVGWNAGKRAYDAWIAVAVALVALASAGGMLLLQPNATAETIVIRTCGLLTFVLLHVILSIGPLCRLDARFLPLLYNRRHLGVTMFSVALIHGAFSIVQFHALGDLPPLVSFLTTSTGWTTVADFPFQIAGALALAILFLMAATSHDFWLHALTPRVWKTLHMLVYAAYALLVVHVAFGALQSEPSAALSSLLIAGVAWVVGVHLAAARKEAAAERSPTDAAADGFIDVCGVDDIPEGRGRVVATTAERVAIFKHNGTLSALSNACRHQNGPLGEGRIIGGCVVCPWHGYEYRPETGAAPPPFTEKVETYGVEVRAGRIFLDPRPHPPGTRIEPTRIPET